MKQSDDSNAFFEKYGFTSSCTMKHPDFGDMMTFEGLESDYVQRLERQVKELEKYIREQNQRIQWLMNQEFYKWKDAEREQDKKKAAGTK